MKIYRTNSTQVCALILFALICTSGRRACAQFEHSDVDLGLNDQGQIVTDHRVYTATFPTSGIAKQYSSNPGFAAESDGLGTLRPHVELLYDVTNSLIYWDGTAIEPLTSDVRIRVDNNPPSTQETIINGMSGPQRGSGNPPVNRIGVASATGEIHSHLSFFLEVDDGLPPLGAYGIELVLSTDSDQIVDSAPFFVVFNYGLSDSSFVSGVRGFEQLLNAESVLGDFDGDGLLQVNDIDLLTAAARSHSIEPRFDVTQDGHVNDLDRTHWVNVLRQTYFGDANLDGEFNTEDLVDVFQVGEYEDVLAGNSNWGAGDWNGDGDCDSMDIVLAFQAGGYEQGPRSRIAVVPEPTSVVLLLVGTARLFMARHAAWRSGVHGATGLVPVSRVATHGQRALAGTTSLAGFSRNGCSMNSWDRKGLRMGWIHYFLSSVCLFAMTVSTSLAQTEHSHLDIEFAYGQERIVVHDESGLGFAGTFPQDGLDRGYTSEPGFASEVDEGLGIAPSDEVAYDVISELLYWHDGFDDVPFGIQLRVVNRPPSPVVADTVVSASSGRQVGSFDPAINRIGAADHSGSFHSDLSFFLEAAPQDTLPAVGAYGFIMSLRSSSPGIQPSAPFALVFNYGLDDDSFQRSRQAISVLVPEPAGFHGLWIAVSELLIVGHARRRMPSS